MLSDVCGEEDFAQSVVHQPFLNLCPDLVDACGTGVMRSSKVEVV